MEGSPVLIADALSRNDSVKVVPDERLYPALKRAGLVAGGVMDLARVRAVASETGGWTAVTGEILSLGRNLRVSARAFDVVSNAEVLRVVETAAEGEDVREVYQRLGTRLIGLAGSQSAAVNLATTTTKSIDAYRAYVRGITHANRSESRRARDAFLEAVRLDSTYAQAYARLADTEMSVDPRQLIDPGSALYRYAARAAALAGNLPVRDRELVLAINDMLSGRFGSTRARLTGLLAQDSANVDALEWMAGLEIFDPILVPAGGGERPRGSMNRGLALAKRVLELDPSRHQLYGSLVQSYLLTGGGTPGIMAAYRQEAASLPALLNTAPARTFFPVLGDTIVLISTDSAFSVPADTLVAARKRALDAARQWAQRWLAAGPSQAEPHLWASRVHSQAGDFVAALGELEAADSLGVETGLENVPARRMSLLALLRRYADGSRIADSLWQANALNFQALTAYQFEGVGWAFTLSVLNRQYDRATAMVERLAASLAPAAALNPQLPAEGLAIVLLTGGARQYFAPPVAVRTSVFDRLLADAPSFAPNSMLLRLMPFHARVLATDTAIARRDLASGLMRAAETLASGGNIDAAYQLVVEAALDSTARRSIDSLAWFVERRHAVRAERAAMQARFQPTGAVVTDSAAVFTWRVDGGTFPWNRVSTAIGEDDYLWEVEFPAAGARYEVLANVAKRPAVSPTAGTLTELLAVATPLLHEVPADSTVPHRTLSRTSVRLEPAAGGFRMVFRDARIVTALRRERPATVRMQFRPCATAQQVPGAKCVDQDVTVLYP